MGILCHLGSMKITFAPLSEAHFPLLLKWFETSHVKAWWDQDISYTADLVKEKYTSYIDGYKLESGVKKAIHGYIIYVDNNPKLAIFKSIMLMILLGRHL